MRKQGEIIFWNGEDGFIKVDDAEESIFFHASRVHEEYTDVQVLDQVSFKVGKSTNPKQLGEPVAYGIRLMGRGDSIQYQLEVGELIQWDGRSGLLKSQELDKLVVLKNTRLTEYHFTLSIGDYFVFNPVNSLYNPEYLFALFAYPLFLEQNHEILRKLWEKYDLPIIGKCLLELDLKDSHLSISEHFEIDLDLLIQKIGVYSYSPIEKLIDQYKQEYSFVPEYENLKSYLTEELLIQLWENEVIDTYNLEMKTRYFFGASAGTKREIITRFTRDDQEQVLVLYFDRLCEKDRFTRINNDLKGFLYLVYRNEKSRQLNLFNQVKELIYQHLSASEIVDLWLKGYLDAPGNTYLSRHFTLRNIPSWQGQDKELTPFLKQLAEDYLGGVRQEFSFTEEYDLVVIALRYLKKIDAIIYGEWLRALNTQLKAPEKFILWLFFPEDFFDAEAYLIENWQGIDTFWLLKYLVVTQSDQRLSNANLKESLLKTITECNLIESAQNFTWNMVVPPIEEGDSGSFLNEVKSYLSLFLSVEINLVNIGKAIFQLIPFYQVEHLRLWIYSYVPPDFLEHQHFRQLFKQLSRTEQKLYRRKGSSWSKEEVEYAESQAVNPCTDFDYDKQIKTYHYRARINNIHFKKNGWALRQHDKEYTLPVEKDQANFSFNRLSMTSVFGKMEFEVLVNENRILNNDALDELFDLVHRAEIRNALAKYNPLRGSNSLDPSLIAYPEDYEFRKKIISYLQEKQIKGVAPELVEEAKAPYRRLDEKTLRQDTVIEMTAIFTLDADDDYLLVWENTDFSEDRATFLFKTTPENYPVQLSELVRYITTQAQLRSTLISRQGDSNLEVLRNDLGFVGKILKPRGKFDSFEIWLGNLERYLNIPVPELPSPIVYYDILNSLKEINRILNT